MLEKAISPAGLANKAINLYTNKEICPNAKGKVKLHDAVYMLQSGNVSPASVSRAQRAFGVVVEIVDKTHCVVVTYGTVLKFKTKMTPGRKYYLGKGGKVGVRKSAQGIGFAFNKTTFFVCPQMW